MTIDQIWTELETDNSFSSGLLVRRSASFVLPDIFIALKGAARTRCIAVLINKSVPVDMSSLIALRDIKVELLPHDKDSERQILVFNLLKAEYSCIFSTLCEDLIASVSNVTNQRQMVKELLNRFSQWESLFDQAGSQGLSSEQQRGLYGELFFLRKYLQHDTNFSHVINSWVGSAKEARDFQFGKWGIEVKTSHGNNHQKVHISNERQLDTGNFEHLFIFHLSLEMRQESGETLNQIVDWVCELLISDFAAFNRFKMKLLEAGYFDQHRPSYQHVGYFIRREAFYSVEGEFPRIEEKDIPNGVGDVKYSIILDRCSGFIRTEQEAFSVLGSHDRVN